MQAGGQGGWKPNHAQPRAPTCCRPACAAVRLPRRAHACFCVCQQHVLALLSFVQAHNLEASVDVEARERRRLQAANHALESEVRRRSCCAAGRALRAWRGCPGAVLTGICDYLRPVACAVALQPCLSRPPPPRPASRPTQNAHTVAAAFQAARVRRAAGQGGGAQLPPGVCAGKLPPLLMYCALRCSVLYCTGPPCTRLCAARPCFGTSSHGGAQGSPALAWGVPDALRAR